MIVSAALFLVSMIGVVIAFLWPGWSDVILLSGPCTIASFILLLKGIRARFFARRAHGARTVVVDGSNVMYWRDGTPQIEPVQEVVRYLTARGYNAGVMFDANAGYLLAGSYLGDKALSKMLKLPVASVQVVPKGSPADPFILDAAREMGAFVVSNDRFRDWAEVYPEVATPGHLVKGAYRQGQLWVDFAVNGDVGKAA